MKIVCHLTLPRACRELSRSKGQKVTFKLFFGKIQRMIILVVTNPYSKSFLDDFVFQCP